MIKRIIYKPKVKRLFDLGGGVCYINMRGSIYFLKSRKYDSIDFLRRVTNYENKTPIEFYNIIHDNYIKECEKVRKTNEKKQAYYKSMRIVKLKKQIKKFSNQIEILKEEVKNDM